MQALISPIEQVSYISGWTDTVPSQPIFTPIPNAERIAEVSETAFPVAPPLFWVDCANNVVADQWYYDSVTQQISEVPPPAPYPQPISQGAQSL